MRSSQPFECASQQDRDVNKCFISNHRTSAAQPLFYLNLEKVKKSSAFQDIQTRQLSAFASAVIEVRCWRWVIGWKINKCFWPDNNDGFPPLGTRVVFKTQVRVLHKYLMKASKGNKGKRRIHHNALLHFQIQHFAPIHLSLLHKDQIECKLELKRRLL